MAAIPSQWRVVTEVNLGLCFSGLGKEEQHQLCRKNLIETGKGVLECAAMWFWPIDKLFGTIRAVEGEEAVINCLAKGKGAIFFTPHLGAWELVGLYIASRYPVTILYRPSRLKKLTPWIQRSRSRSGATLVSTEPQGIRSLYHALKQGRAVAMLPDQDVSEGGIFATFCGVPAATTRLVYRLMTYRPVPIIFTYAERLPKGSGYVIRFILLSEEQCHGDELRVIQNINDMIENYARRHPTQYLWSYRRFRTRPPGEKGFY